MSNNPDDPELLTDEDLERRYRINRGTLRSLRHRRQIPFIRLGARIVRYRKTELEAWLAEHTVTAKGA